MIVTKNGAIDGPMNNMKRIAFNSYLNWRYPLDALNYLWFECKWFVQRGLYGYADCDVWSLDGYLCEWLPSALRRFKTGHSYPGTGLANKMEKWAAMLETMALGFESYDKMWGEVFDVTSVEGKQLIASWDKGSKLFIKWFGHLWD